METLLFHLSFTLCAFKKKTQAFMSHECSLLRSQKPLRGTPSPRNYGCVQLIFNSASVYKGTVTFVSLNETLRAAVESQGGGSGGWFRSRLQYVVRHQSGLVKVRKSIFLRLNVPENKRNTLSVNVLLI